MFVMLTCLPWPRQVNSFIGKLKGLFRKLQIFIQSIVEIAIEQVIHKDKDAE